MAKKLSEIKDTLDSHVGQRLTLKANSGRRKTVERSGVLAETYPSIFVVQLDQESVILCMEIKKDFLQTNCFV